MKRVVEAVVVLVVLEVVVATVVAQEGQHNRVGDFELE